MKSNNLEAKTDEELFILLNYRVEELEEKIANLCKSVNGKTTLADIGELEKDIGELEKKVSILWDWRNKVIGFSIAVGVIGGLWLLSGLLAGFSGLK